MAASHGLNKYTHIPPQSDGKIPTRKACCARRAKRPRQGWRGRSAWMRESFAIGQSRPCDGSRLTATSHQPPATSHFPDPPLRPQTTRPSPQSDTQIPTRKACYARRAKRPRQGWRGRSAWMRESFAIGHSRPCDDSRLTAISSQPPAISSLPPAISPSHKKKRQAGFPLTCRFCNEPQLTPDKLLFVFSRVVFVFCIRFRRNLFIVVLCFRRDIFLAFRHATVD